MKKTLVVGASPKPNRYSYLALNRLKEEGHEVEALGLRASEALGVPILPLDKKNEIEQPHTVTMYVNPMRQESLYDWLVDLKPERVIFNPGTENPAFASRLEKEGIKTQEACTLVLLSVGAY